MEVGQGEGGISVGGKGRFCRAGGFPGQVDRPVDPEVSGRWSTDLASPAETKVRVAVADAAGLPSTTTDIVIVHGVGAVKLLPPCPGERVSTSPSSAVR